MTGERKPTSVVIPMRIDRPLLKRVRAFAEADRRTLANAWRFLVDRALGHYEANGKKG